jgi:hypothetical protein
MSCEMLYDTLPGGNGGMMWCLFWSGACAGRRPGTLQGLVLDWDLRTGFWVLLPKQHHMYGALLTRTTLGFRGLWRTDVL